MKKLVELMGGLELVDVLDEEEILEMDVRYVGTDYLTNVDIYEERFTGKFFGKINFGCIFFGKEGME